MTNSRPSFDDIPSMIGTMIHGKPFTLGLEDHQLFRRATWLDRAYPDDVEEFPDTLVEGFWLLSMVDAILRLSTSTDSSTMWGLNYGLDRVRFIAPVHFGQQIMSTFETVDVIPKDGAYKVLRRCTFQVEGSDTPAMIADWWGYALPRGTVEPARRTASSDGATAQPPAAS